MPGMIAGGPGGGADGDCRNSVSFSTANNGTTFTSRYAWNINSDTGVGSTHDTSGNAQHNVSFSATAAGGYRLDISTTRNGDFASRRPAISLARPLAFQRLHPRDRAALGAIGSCSIPPKMPHVEAFLISAGLVAVAEIGDKTQLLAMILATRYRRPVPIILGILVATLANHALAAWAGAAVAAWLGPDAMRWILGVLFLAMAGWCLIPDKEDEGPKVAGAAGA